ncbi:hypothetical protein KEF85_06615 [Methylomonas paludis]|uniref:Lipoprotein n=1 Tax=Methylomonas paludis TaxID=1173101 RepID=A0A975MQL5_9GAMM|nr:hypothetical protein [Methylomonas paludis]QWF72115.1 hypothetical protein KEF85_06615 [Methylomonas paludis]
MTLARAGILLCLAGMSGCATVPANSGQVSFVGYAEAVFRHQNEVSSRLMMLSEAEQLPETEEFDHAQEAMDNACHYLNEYAERENSHEIIGWHFKAKVQDSVQACDQAVQHMEALLNTVPKQP